MIASQLMDNKYPYDNVVNILGIANAAKPASSDIGGASSHMYEYDAINRLISAQGSAKNESYELQMRYDVMSNPVQKDSITYEYETYSHPNAESRAGSKIFKYDANGNPISVEDTTTNALRVMQWDEENRLQSLGDDGYVSRYTYNHAGERVVKSHGGTTVAYVNGAPQGVIWDDQDNWTAYVSPYMVVNGDRFTKHYYVGSQRIASKIGVGKFYNLYDASKSCVTAGQKDYAERVSLITQSRDDYNAALGIAPGPPTAKGIYGEAEYSGAYGSYAIKPLGNYDVPTGWPSKPYKRPYGGTPGAPVMYQKPSDPDDTGAGYGYSNAEGLSENDVYFYHSDHLGSTSYITDKDGNAVQHIAYKPFGETLIDEHAVSYDSPWKFNGKEWDSETGLYYYGARYYEPGLSLWYGVDALAEKYPAMGGYVYCVGNPVRIVDPDGNDWYITNNGESTTPVYFEGHDEHEGFTNMGESFCAISNNGNQRNFNADGSITRETEIDEIVAKANFCSEPELDASGIQISLSYCFVVGAGIDVRIGQTRSNEYFLSVDLNAEVGFDIGLSAGTFFSNYSNNGKIKPDYSPLSMEGLGVSQGVGMGLGYSYSTPLVPAKDKKKNNYEEWTTYSTLICGVDFGFNFAVGKTYVPLVW